MSILRTASTNLINALAAGPVRYRADIFAVTLQTGTVYRWTSWQDDLVVSGNTFTSMAPWLRRSKWNVVNTMEVPSLDVIITANNAAPNLKTLAHNGQFDGATLLLDAVFMPTPGDTTTYGKIGLFYGDVGKIQVIGTEVTLTVKGRNNRMSVPLPRNLFQAGCLHTFCDAGCTLNRTTFTASYAVGTSPAPSGVFLPWASAPSTPARYEGGTITMTSGAANGQVRSIVTADSTGLTLVYPLYGTPVTGDTFTAFQGCDKTINTCNTRYTNLVNFRGFPYIPVPDVAGHGSI